MRWWSLSFATVLFLGACTPSSQETPTTTTPIASVTTTTAVPSDEMCRAGDLPFSEAGLIAALGDDVGDAATVTEIRWDPSASCERVTVTFGADSGAPATTLGPTGVSLIAYAGVIRVVLPADVDGTAVADTLLEGEFVRAAYVVRAEDHIAIDIHAPDGVPIAARAFTTTSPASLVVDVTRADTEAVPVGVTASSTAVIVDPPPGANQYPVVVEAYAAPGMEMIHVALVADGIPLIDEPINLAGNTDAWQLIETSIDDGPIGASTVFVGSVDEEGIPGEGSLVSITTE